VRPKTLRALACAAPTLAVLSTTLLAVAVPAVASISTGGTTAVAAPSAPALTIAHARRDVLAGRRITVGGALRAAGAGRTVALQITGRRGRWLTVDRDRTDARGRYALAWRADGPGSHRLRVRFAGDAGLPAARRSAGRANVYRRALASWYGPGLYGGHLACGGSLDAGTLGVANKTLPCGTKVTLRYRGRKVRVAVVDRGPYVGNREFDLTAATRARLGFGSTGTVLTTE
jgi:rare lipoprotein A